MKLAYFSVTGQTRRFVSKTDLPNVEITPDDDVEMDEPFLLITPSYAEESPTVSKSIDVMDSVFDFMAYNDNYKHCRGIIGTGNRNFTGIYNFNFSVNVGTPENKKQAPFGSKEHDFELGKSKF